MLKTPNERRRNTIPNLGTESEFEETTIDRLKALGYRYQYGEYVERPHRRAVVLVEEVRAYLERRYHELPPEAVQQAIDIITNPVGVDTGRRNMAFQKLFLEGFDLNYEAAGELRSVHIHLANFEQAELNEFLVVNQLTIEGSGTGNTRRPDLVETMAEIRAKLAAEAQLQAELDLNDEEKAFYDVIVLGEAIKLHQEDAWIAELVREVVATVRANLEVDWTKPHRSNIHATVQSAVSRVLRQRRIRGEQFTFLRKRLMERAKVMYEKWPMVG